MQEGLEVDWSVDWKAKVPFFSAAKNTSEVEVSFGVGQSSSVTSNTQDIDLSAKFTLTPMTGVKATAMFVKSVLTTNALVKVKKTYSNGATQTCEVHAKYTGVACNLAEILLVDIPVGPANIQ